MNLKMASDKISDYLNGHLSTNERHDFERLISDHPSLRKEVRRQEQAMALIRRNRNPPNRDLHLERIVMQAGAAFAGMPQRVSIWRRLRLPVLVTAALLIPAGLIWLLPALKRATGEPMMVKTIGGPQLPLSSSHVGGRLIQVHIPTNDPNIAIYWTFEDPEAKL